MPLIFGQPKIYWQAIPGVDLHWKLWGEEYVVYNSGSGHTHLLDPVVAFLVQQIMERSWETADLLEHAQKLLGFEMTAESREKLQKTLTELEDLGLIEAVTLESS